MPFLARSPRLTALLLSLTALACWPTAAAARPKDTTPLNLPSSSPEPASSGVGAGTFVRTLVALIAVLGIVWIVYRAMKFLAGQQQSGPGRAAEVTLISHSQLDKQLGIYVVRVGDVVQTIAVGSGQAPTVTRTLTSVEARAEGLDMPGAAPAAGATAKAAISDLRKIVASVQRRRRGQRTVGDLLRDKSPDTTPDTEQEPKG